MAKKKPQNQSSPASSETDLPEVTEASETTEVTDAPSKEVAQPLAEIKVDVVAEDDDTDEVDDQAEHEAPEPTPEAAVAAPEPAPASPKTPLSLVEQLARAYARRETLEKGAFVAGRIAALNQINSHLRSLENEYISNVNRAFVVAETEGNTFPNSVSVEADVLEKALLDGIEIDWTRRQVILPQGLFVKVGERLKQVREKYFGTSVRRDQTSSKFRADPVRNPDDLRRQVRRFIILIGREEVIAQTILRTAMVEAAAKGIRPENLGITLTGPLAAETVSVINP